MREEAARAAAALRLRARRDAASLLAGGYRSAFRGPGLTFEELREYTPGDDAGWIEWHATARLNRPIVKGMREERDLLVAILLDVSASLDYGRAPETKKSAALRVAAALSMAAIRARDRIALVTFADGVLHAVAPGGGALQLERTLRVLETSRGAGPTAAGPALEWAADRLPRHSLAILISDFYFPDPGQALARCARKHDLIALRLRDPADSPPRATAPVRVEPLETGKRELWRPSASRVRPSSAPFPPERLTRAGAEVCDLWTGHRLIPSLHRFFDERARRLA